MTKRTASEKTIETKISLLGFTLKVQKVCKKSKKILNALPQFGRVFFFFLLLPINYNIGTLSAL
jgi:hypothetical protein